MATGHAIEREILRDAMLASLRKSEPQQYVSFQSSVALVLSERGLPTDGGGAFGPPTLRRVDDRRFREILWSLINIGVLVQGVDAYNAQWPFISLTEMGEEFLANPDPDVYDPTKYLADLEALKPLDATERRFLGQAVRAFSINLPDAAAVMLGAAAEHLIMTLRDEIGVKDPVAAAKVSQLADKPALTVLMYLAKYFEDRKAKLPRKLRDEVSTTFTGVAQMIRSARNDAGHPDSRAVDHSHCLVLLRIFPQFRKWSIAIIDVLPL